MAQNRTGDGAGTHEALNPFVRSVAIVASRFSRTGDASTTRFKSTSANRIEMPLRTATAFIGMMIFPLAVQAEENCPKNFQNYGVFLQAKQSCGRDSEYPFMTIMKACAKETPREKAVTLIDGGRRAFARGVMRSSLGSMCAEVFAQLPAAPPARKR
ncbi:hypothetical protein [Methylobacterium soli]|uniref:Uncharacterized protein n=1 Tax=Methylobacterium soli TaxID=553447 RepID=A0A6L3T061_9HYPH|nr:hypothetical protein [Methylobacterium soli]KAB1079849.1 hypothetical protein F6X53_08785 [Methylobacterium soli]